MKKKSLLAVVFLLSALAAFGEELTYARPKTNGLDIELSQVHLIAEAFDEERIAYRFELAEGKKLSCIETQKTLRIRQMTPSQGTLYVFIPKTMLLENCSIRISRANIRLEGIQAVHILAMLNMGSVTTSECVFKNAVINLARGSLSYDKTQISITSKTEGRSPLPVMSLPKARENTAARKQSAVSSFREERQRLRSALQKKKQKRQLQNKIPETDIPRA